MNKNISNNTSNLDFGNWNELIENTKSQIKRETNTKKSIPQNTVKPIKPLSQKAVSSINNQSPKLVTLKPTTPVQKHNTLASASKENVSNIKNQNTIKEATASSKKLLRHKKNHKFILSEKNFSTKDTNANKIYAQKLASEDLELITKFKKAWFFFIPIIGLILFIRNVNCAFCGFKLYFSRKTFDDNGLGLIIIIGVVIVAVMFSTIATYLVCVFLLGLFNNLSGATSLAEFIISVLVLVIGFILIIHYFFVCGFLFYVLPKTQKNYDRLLERTISKVEWNNPSSILKELDE